MVGNGRNILRCKYGVLGGLREQIREGMDVRGYQKFWIYDYINQKAG
jgi:hypothetical protein